MPFAPASLESSIPRSAYRLLQAVWTTLSPHDRPGSSSCLLHDLLRSLFTVNSSGNAHVVGRMLKQENIDDLRIGPDGLVSDFNDVTDQLRLAGLRKAGGDMTLNIGHSYLRSLISNERSALCRWRCLQRTQADV